MKPKKSQSKKLFKFLLKCKDKYLDGEVVDWDIRSRIDYNNGVEYSTLEISWKYYKPGNKKEENETPLNPWAEDWDDSN